MYDSRKILSEIATKRLNAIKEFTELGSGLSIAMRDLALRGAGDILGSEQAGFVDSIGIELFTKILKEEIDKLKGIFVPEEEDSTLPLIDVDTFVDNKYVDDEDLKIEIHKMINEIDNFDKLIEIKEKLEDRFGRVSEELMVYMYEQWFEAISRKLKVKRVKQSDSNVEIIFDKEMTNKIDGEKLFFSAFEINKNFIFGTSFGCLTIKLNIRKLEKHFIYYLVDLMQLVEKSIKKEAI
jgi:transcription-repair coupling factor (superfamily II helicase)